MRDVKRIKPIMEELEKAWNKVPDMRFGQFIYLLADKQYEKTNISDIFHPEDDVWLEVLKDFNKPKYKK